MSAKFYTLLTETGAAKLASAAALGIPLNITQMAVGDGGGTLPTPNARQTTLIAEKRRAPINMLYIDPKNSSQIIAEQVIPETEGGWWIREVGLFDDTGALIAVGNCPESYKPQLVEGSGRTQTVRMVLITSSTDHITLKIDPAVVLATRQYADEKAIEVRGYVDTQIKAHEQSRSHPDATLSAKGFVQLSNDDNSSSETKAATPAAVKKVRDQVETKAPLDSPAFSGTPTAPTPSSSAKGRELATAEFVAGKIAALIGSAPGVMDTLQEIAAALNNNPNFANEIIRQLAAKQPLDATLTALSSKSVNQLLEYLGLQETINLAANAWSKNIVGTLRDGGTFASCNKPGIYNVAIADASTVSDFPKANGLTIYSYGMMIVLPYGDVIEQLYTSHHGHIASRQTWNGKDGYLPWAVQYSSVNEPTYFKYGCPLIGTCISWCNERMPQEIWPDIGMEFIPWMGQAFDPQKYPLAHALWPDNHLPVDMRGYGIRAWDHGRGIDSGRGLLSYQEDALQNFTGTMRFNEMLGGVPSSGVFNEQRTWTRNTYRNKGGGYSSTITFNPATVARTAAETRGKNVAWNMIVRVK